MRITIGAKCWDGERRKSLTPPVIKAEAIPEVAVEQPPRYRFSSMEMSGVIGIIPLTLTLGMLPDSAHAAALTMAPEAVPVLADATKAKILHAFDPLINMIQALSYPIAGVMIAGGCLFIMCGNRERGMQMLQNAAIGYILVQLSPMLLELLVGIGNSV